VSRPVQGPGPNELSRRAFYCPLRGWIGRTIAAAPERDARSSSIERRRQYPRPTALDVRAAESPSARPKQREHVVRIMGAQHAREENALAHPPLRHPHRLSSSTKTSPGPLPAKQTTGVRRRPRVSLRAREVRVHSRASTSNQIWHNESNSRARRSTNVRRSKESTNRPKRPGSSRTSPRHPTPPKGQSRGASRRKHVTRLLEPSTTIWRRSTGTNIVISSRLRSARSRRALQEPRSRARGKYGAKADRDRHVSPAPPWSVGYAWLEVHSPANLLEQTVAFLHVVAPTGRHHVRHS